MYNIRTISLICSPLRRHLSKAAISFNTNKSLLFFPLNKKVLNADCRHVSTNFCLQSSEVAAEKQMDEKEIKKDQSDPIDSKLGKYIDLATDSEREKNISVILMEHEVAKLEGKKVPSRISVDEMRELLNMYSFSSRVKYMAFLFERELRRNAEKQRKEFRKKEREVWLVEKQNLKPPEHIQYGIGHNTTVLRVRKKSVMRVYNQRLANAVLHDQKFIVDMDYDCFMRKQDCNNCGEQLLELYGVNRRSRQPYDLHFCNVDLNSTTMAAFNRFMPNYYAPENFITMSKSSYLDLFPKEKLVYINPYAREPLKTYDHDAVYIIGGLVDKCIKEPVVLAKAKREGIRCVHLPYDEYLMWGRSNKSLPLNQIMEILLEMKMTNDWEKAFRHVPQRKLVRSLDLFSEFN